MKTTQVVMVEDRPREVRVDIHQWSPDHVEMVVTANPFGYGHLRVPPYALRPMGHTIARFVGARMVFPDD
jgi:hypothetical protein